MRNILVFIAILLFFSSFIKRDSSLKVSRSFSIDSLGACQGVSYQNGRVFLYGDRETGIIREYKLEMDSLIGLNNECKFTLEGKDLINHPTGIAYNGTGPTFIGNSIRLNKEGTQWKAVIYCVNWDGFLKTRTLDGNLKKVIDDDACIQGTRPEYVKYRRKWYVATADYGNTGNEVRLYDPEALLESSKTSESGVLVKKFQCSPWVQNLHWIPEKGILILIQNQIEGRRWRFTYLDLERSVESGKEVVLKVIDIEEKDDELEGFAFVGKNYLKGLAVTSSRRNNVSLMETNW